MSEDPKEVEQLILKLNREFYDQTSGEREYMVYQPFSAVLCGEVQAINMFDVPLWNSDDDERNVIDHEFEPLEKFTRREAQKFLDKIKNVKLNVSFAQNKHDAMDGEL